MSCILLYRTFRLARIADVHRAEQGDHGLSTEYPYVQIAGWLAGQVMKGGGSGVRVDIVLRGLTRRDPLSMGHRR
jgi:hypothetical protein